MDPKDYVTTKEAGEYLGRSTNRIFQLIVYEKRLPAVRVGWNWLIKKSDLKKFKLKKPTGRPPIAKVQDKTEKTPRRRIKD